MAAGTATTTADTTAHRFLTTSAPTTIGLPPATGLLDPTGVTRILAARALPDETLRRQAFCLRSLQRLLTLEQVSFPNLRPRLLDVTDNALNPDAVLLQAEDFLNRVSDDLFPVAAHYATDHDWACEQELEVPWFLNWIPLEPVGADYVNPSEVYGDGIFGNRDLTDFLMGIAVNEVWNWDEHGTRVATDRWHEVYAVQLPPGFKLSEVVAILDIYPPASPYDDLANACRFVLQNTGNFWLDIGYTEMHENSYEAMWLHGDMVAILRDEWEQAQPILSARNRLEQYMDENDGREPLRYRRLVNLLINTWQTRHGQLLLPCFQEAQHATPYPD